MAAPRVYDSSLTADAPHFAPPTTPSRSPFKDALHRRSPTKQLRAGAKATLNSDEYNRLMSSDISTAAEKELATRVVRAADRLKEWCREIEQWGWSGSFDSKYAGGDGDPFERREELSASLSPDVVEEYDARLDAIAQDLEDLEIDDLKEQILGIHLGRSRPSSSYSSVSTTNLVLYDDFQLFVTESLLHTLPYHAKLKQHLKLWHIRIDVFRQVPSYLSGLSFLEEILQEAWQGLKHASTPEMDEEELNALEESLLTAQSALRYKVSQLGKQLDRMLDTLEGQEDCLPDEWIDKFEGGEKSYAEWSYQAERKLFQLRHMEKPVVKTKSENLAPVSIGEVAQHVGKDADSVKLDRPGEDLERDLSVSETDSSHVPFTVSETTTKIEDTNTSFIPAEIPEHPTIVDLSFANVDASTPPVSERHEPILEPAHAKAEDDLPTSNGEQDEPGASDVEEEPVIAEAVHRPVEAILRRASVASIESFTRDQVRIVAYTHEHRANEGVQVKSVDVPSRRSSVASFSSIKRPVSRNFDSSVVSTPNNEGRRPSRTTSPLATEPTAAWPDIMPSIEPDRPQTPPPSVPTIRRNSTSSIASSETNHSDDLEAGEESPSVRASLHHVTKPPLNMAMKKRRSKQSIDSSRTGSNLFSDHDLALDTSLPTIPASPTKTKSPGSPSMALDEQISNILESLPARIKLKSSSTPGAPEIKPKRTRKSSTASTTSTTSDAPRPGLRSRAATPSLTGRPGITLAPADDQVPRRGGANEPEIKVYHLMSGNEKPLKLFIRRVGENGERVMVRVGGGWADLAEYLKTYAEHHGHRAVSEGRVEVLGLGNDRVVTPTPGSNGRSSALGFRSDSRMEGRSESRLGTRSDSRQEMSRNNTASIGYPSISAGKEVASSPEPASTPFQDADQPTPTSTSGANGSQPRRSSAFWDEGGLMGPAAVKKNNEISSEKKEWVDSVVEQARKVGRKVEFGDLGKKGGTRRVFVRGGRVVSGSGNGEAGKE
jgi:hypothetical protein